MKTKKPVKPRVYHLLDDDGVYVPQLLLKAEEGTRRVLVVDLSEGSLEALRDKISEEAAVALLSAYVRGQIGANVVSEPREDYALADKILSALGIRRSHRNQSP